MIRRPWIDHAVSTVSPKIIAAELMINSGVRYPVASKNMAASSQNTNTCSSRRARGGTQRSSAKAIREKSNFLIPRKNAFGASLKMMPR